MSSTMTKHNPRKSRTPKLSNTGPNLSKKVLLNITSLSNYNSDNPLKQHMINQIQDTYKLGDITNFKTANTALTLLISDNDFNKCQTSFNNITKLKNTKHEESTINYIKKLIQH